MYSEHAEALISINGTMFVVLISFLLFVFVFNRVMYRPLLETIRDRDAHVEEIREGIESSKKEIADLKNLMKERESAARKQADEAGRKLEEAGGREAGRILSSAREDIELLRKRTQNQIDAQIEEARLYIKNESEVLALSIMEKVLDRRV